MSGITTHVLDTAMGKPGIGIEVLLEIKKGNEWSQLSGGQTNNDGRVPELIPKGHAIAVGTYRISFKVANYFAAQKRDTFYPSADIVFEVKDATQHYHVPLLVSPFSYSTYRGS